MLRERAMPQTSTQPNRSERLSFLSSVYQAVDRFDAAWQEALRGNGTPPRIEDFLTDASEPQRSALLRELLVVELECRSSKGQRPTQDEYLQRFPDGELIRRKF